MRSISTHFWLVLKSDYDLCTIRKSSKIMLYVWILDRNLDKYSDFWQKIDFQILFRFLPKSFLEISVWWPKIWIEKGHYIRHIWCHVSYFCNIWSFLVLCFSFLGYCLFWINLDFPHQQQNKIEILEGKKPNILVIKFRKLNCCVTEQQPRKFLGHLVLLEPQI